MDTDKIKTIMNLFEDSHISRMNIQDGDLKITLEKDFIKTEINSVQENIQENKKEELENYIVKSPLVGTYYQASGENQEPYIKIGDKVNIGDTLCIIEAMKVMNEIKSEINGTVLDIKVKNGETVEYDQPLIVIGEEQ